MSASPAAIDTADLLALLEDLHRGPFDDPPWSAFFRRLQAVTEADQVNLTFRRRDAPMNELTSFLRGHTPKAFSSGYLAGRYRTDPLPYHALTPGQVYATESLIAPGQQDGAARLRAFLDAAGIRHLRIVRVTEPAGYTAWLTIARQGDPDFAPSASDLLEILARHLATALQAVSALETSRRQQEIYETAVRRLNVAVLTLDSTARILSGNDAAMRLLDEGVVMRRGLGERLVLTSAVAKRRLAVRLQQFLAEPHSPPATLQLSDEPRRDMLLAPVRQRPMSGLHTPVVTAYVQADLAAGAQAEGLMTLYRLTASEARLALALANGRSIAEAAADVGLTEESARTYTKRIYQKTGVARQAELVRAVFMSLLILP